VINCFVGNLTGSQNYSLSKLHNTQQEAADRERSMHTAVACSAASPGPADTRKRSHCFRRKLRDTTSRDSKADRIHLSLKYDVILKDKVQKLKQGCLPMEGGPLTTKLHRDASLLANVRHSRSATVGFATCLNKPRL